MIIIIIIIIMDVSEAPTMRLEALYNTGITEEEEEEGGEGGGRKISICKAQNIVHGDYLKSSYVRAHTQRTRTHEHSDYTHINLHSLKRTSR